jgi:hypothetical protein
MSPEKLLQEAKAASPKRGLESYLETVLELRRKGNSYRQIAEFLNEKGITTDHTTVYRLVSASNPLLVSSDDGLLLGDVVYESRKGRPLRPFDTGLLITIVKKLRIIPTDREAPVSAIWCEAQFELNEAPNYRWLNQLSKCLNINWNPETPCHLQARFGFEIKFEGNLMALVCQTFNLENAMRDVGTGVKAATKLFEKDKERHSRRQKLVSERNAELLKHVHMNPGESKESVVEECLEWIREDAEKLTRRFNSIPMP